MTDERWADLYFHLYQQSIERLNMVVELAEDYYSIDTVDGLRSLVVDMRLAALGILDGDENDTRCVQCSDASAVDCY